jgi:hypothetical protein
MLHRDEKTFRRYIHALANMLRHVTVCLMKYMNKSMSLADGPALPSNRLTQPTNVNWKASPMVCQFDRKKLPGVAAGSTIMAIGLVE